MAEVPGREFNGISLDHPSFIDDEYCVVAAHVDEALRRQIDEGSYVDFNKLLPRDISNDEEGVLELVYKEGKTFWVPANTVGQNNQINSFAKWEQAFRVFSDIYTRVHPDRAFELIQYNHLINTAALTFAWENVYLYDRDFRRHMARHPQRSWSVILQQAWTIQLKDRHRGGGEGHVGEHKKSKRRDICFRYNRGKCSYGDKCKFEHKCGICNRYGHGAYNCRRGSSSYGRGDRDRRDHHKRDDRGDDRKKSRRDDHHQQSKGQTTA